MGSSVHGSWVLGAAGLAAGWRAGRWHRQRQAGTASSSCSKSALRKGGLKRLSDKSPPEPAESAAGLSCLLPLLGTPGAPGCGHVPPSLPLTPRSSSPPPKPLSPLSYKDPVMDVGPAQGTQDGLTLRSVTQLHLPRPFVQIRPHSQVPVRGEDANTPFGVHYLPHTGPFGPAGLGAIASC